MTLNDTDDATGDDGCVAVPSGSARRRWSAAEKAAVVRETLAPGARVSDVARRWQVDAQQVYRWRNRDGVTHGGTMPRNDTAEPAFVPIVTDAMPVGEAAGARILLATRPIDFRKGAHGLAALAQEVLGEDPFSGVVIVYRAKRSDRVKILVWDNSGLVLIWKQLQHGSFRWPPVMDGVMTLSAGMTPSRSSISRFLANTMAWMSASG